MTIPDVSVIIPCFNAVDYVGESIRSVLDQSIAEDRAELIVVDDGSTDGSGEVISRLASQEPRMTVITQANSGTAGGARNPGIDAARGEFVFFLDADDLLTPEALERMVDVALAEESDVVLGRLAGMDGRKVPSSMFRRTVLDADLVEDRVFNTLGPTKLIRRSLIEREGLRFPEDLTVGEDEPFIAAVYLSARKISVLSDMDYYLARYRADGENLTLGRRTAASHAELALRVAAVVEERTEPGERRDALLKRPFGRPLARALGARWLKMLPTERAELAGRLREALGPLCTEGARRQLESETRAKIDLLMAGDLDGLERYIAHLSANPTPMIVRDCGEFRRRLPSDLAELVPPAERTVPAPTIACRLDDVEVEGADVTVSATVRIPQLEGEPDEIIVRARQREGEEVRDARSPEPFRGSGAGRWSVRGVLDGLPLGVWDVHVVVRIDDWVKEIRLGADRSRAIEPEGVSNIGEDPAPEERRLAYFTKGHGNLSIDVGAVLHPSFALAHARGLVLDESGCAMLLVQTTREPTHEDEFFAEIEGVRRHGGRQLLPTVRLGERLLGLRLPVSARSVGATVAVSSVVGGVPAPLPIDGARFWSARAAGFGLEQVSGGRIRVVPGPARPGARSRRGALAERLEPTARRLSGSRAADAVKELPVVGPALRSTVQRLRGRR